MGRSFRSTARATLCGLAESGHDTDFRPGVRTRIIERTEAAIGRINRQGLSSFRLVPGSIGSAARAMGGACLPLLANFTQDREVLFKENG